MAIPLAPAKPWQDDWLVSQAPHYLADAVLRRQVLEASLTNPNNSYSAVRLGAYGKQTEGWDTLPVWNPKVQAVTATQMASFAVGAPPALGAQVEPLWGGNVPTNMSGWVALGRKVFFLYPLRAEVSAEYALRSERELERLGIEADAEGGRPGLVVFKDIDARTKVGITCALCHTAMEEGRLVEGRARRQLDFGEMRLAFNRDKGIVVSEDLSRRMASWGPGRADITQDDDEDPVAIVDLWGMVDHEYLMQAATIRQVHPIALAIRQETQLLHAAGDRVRPPRELAWALAMYMYSLKPPAKAVANSSELVEGKRLFEEHCGYCHQDRNYGGLPVSADAVKTDPVLAKAKARGTGLYRPSPLLAVGEAAPYLHDGTVATLEELLGPERTGPGHRYGSALSKSQRDAMIAFLNTL